MGRFYLHALWVLPTCSSIQSTMSKTHFKNITPSTPMLPKLYRPLTFSNQTSACICHFHHVHYVSYPHKVQYYVILSSFIFNALSLRSKNHSQHVPSYIFNLCSYHFTALESKFLINTPSRLSY